MPLANLGFETDDGGTPNEGVPASWTIAIITQAEQVAAFGSSTPPLDEDAFEIEWNNSTYLFAFDLADTAPPLLDTDVSDGEAVEDYEEGWSNNQGYLFELNTGTDAVFDSALTPDADEDFGDGWDSGPSAGNGYELVLGASVLAEFGTGFAPQDFEAFADGWDLSVSVGNAYAFTMGSTTAASFDGVGAEAYEDFEEARTEILILADAGTNLITAAALHGFGVADRVSFRVSDSLPGALPGGLSPAFVYFVLSSGLTTTEFRVSTTSGGTQIDITDAGVGACYLVHDKTRYWVIQGP